MAISGDGTAIEDIDRLGVRVLIVVHQRLKFDPVYQYLSRRGWLVEVTASLNEAIKYVITSKPDLVLLSVNHPHPQVPKLPGFLNQSLKTPCVLFGENADNKTMARLNNSTYSLKILERPSGPTIDRKLKQILQEKFKSEEEFAKTRLARNQHLQSKTKGAPSTPKITENQKSKLGLLPNAQKSHEPNHPIIQQGNKSGTGGGPIVIGGNTPKKEAAFINLTKNSKSKSHLVMPEGGENVDSLLPDYEGMNTNGDLNLLKPSETSADQWKDNEGDENFEDLSLLLAQAAHESTENYDPESATLTNDVVLEPPGSKESLLVGAEINRMPQEFNFFFQAVNGAATHLGGESVSEASKILDAVSQLGVIPVSSEDICGYLVVANADQDSTFLSMINEYRDQLIGLLFDQKRKDILIDSAFLIDTSTVEFKDWAHFCGSVFINKSIQGKEFVIAFFEVPLESSNFKIDLNSNLDMASVKIEELSTRAPVNFKTFLYLPKNDKYFLYLKEGRTLSEKQKANLVESKVADVFIPKEDIQKFKIYSASNLINDLIESFYIDQQKKSA